MIRFEPFQENHLSVFRQWLLADHVQKFWQESDDDEQLKRKFIDELPGRSVWAFIINLDAQAIGYIQYYDAAKVGGGWWENESPGTFGIDLLIGEVNYTGKGHGVKITQSFVDFIKKREPTLESVIIDPDPENKRAVHTFAKAGFVAESEITTPGGKALLMRLRP